MTLPHSRGSRALGGLALLACALAPGVSASAQQPATPPPATTTVPSPTPAVPPDCTVDLTLPGRMSDILSNVLLREKHRPSTEVSAFLDRAVGKHRTGDALLQAAADHFKIDQRQLEQLVERYRHINCAHEPIPGYVVPDAHRPPDLAESATPLPVSAFAADVTLHVVLHELGHAVIREFDLMVLGNEETMADAFATHLLTEHFPDRAVAAITARVASLLIEAAEVPRVEWPVNGEHDNDARRAFQIAALAVAADPVKFAPVATLAGLTERDIRRARDYGSDIHRAWRRTLTPLMMPTGRRSTEARFRAHDSFRLFLDAGSPSLQSVIESAVSMIDWHSQVTVDFVPDEGGAAWNRSQRTITVNAEYLRRFIEQGAKAETAPKGP